MDFQARALCHIIAVAVSCQPLQHLPGFNSVQQLVHPLQPEKQEWEGSLRPCLACQSVCQSSPYSELQTLAQGKQWGFLGVGCACPKIKLARAVTSTKATSSLIATLGLVEDVVDTGCFLCLPMLGLIKQI